MHQASLLARRLCVLAGLTLACLSPDAAAQVIDAFPPSLPGYENDYLLPGPPPVQDGPDAAASRGIRFGDITLSPALTELGGYDTNPDGVSPGGSALEETRVSLGAQSDWRRDALDAALTLDDLDYPCRTLDSQTDWTASAAGTLDLGRGHLDLAYSHLAQNLDPQQLGTEGVTAPIPYTDDDLRTDADIVLGQLRLIPAFDAQLFHFDDKIPADQAASFGALDRTELAETLTGLLDLSEGRALLAILRDTQAAYRPPAGVPDPNYNDLLAAVGLDFQTDAPIRLRAVAGGERRDADTGGTVTTPFFEASVLWQPTRLTGVTLTFRRRLADAATTTAGTDILTEGRLELDHALRRNVLLTAFADVGASDYQEGAAGSSQRVENYGASIEWAFSRHATLSLNYAYDKDDEGAGLRSGISNAITLGLTLQE